MGIVGMVVPFALSALLGRCAPSVGPITMSAIVMHESGGNPYAIGDNTTHRSYFPPDAASAIARARALLQAGDNVDLGYAQINSQNLAPQGLDVAQAFEPCRNLATGARILRAAYAGAERRFGPGQIALAHALSAYNSGGYYAAMPYARDVYATAAALRYHRNRRAIPSGRAVAFHRAAQPGEVAK
jgi:type IV secretion system protein VirB1